MAFQRTKISLAAATLLSGLALTPIAQAQNEQRIEITGSSIKRVDAETALPVTVLKVDELRQQGFITVEDIVHSIAANQSSLGTSQAIGGITGGAAFADLRGLGRNKTLVLLNGRRLVNQAVGGAGDSSAPDLNTIPLAAIDRIEVLRDGASSLYGTDAIGGVINFITKRDFQGGTASAEYSVPQHPGGKSGEVSLGFGRGDLGKDRWNVFGFIDYQRQDVLSTPQRSSFATATKTSPTGFPGTWSQGSLAATPGAPDCAGQFQAKSTATTCNYYYWNWVDLVPKSERLTGMLKGTFALSADHTLSVEYTAAQTDVWTNVAPVPEGALTMYSTKRVNGVDTGVANPFFPAAADPTKSIRVRWRTIPAGPRADHNDNFQQRLVASLDGTLGAWDYSTGLSVNSLKTTDTLTGGYVSDAVIRELLASGKLNPFVSPLPADMQTAVQGAVLPGKLFDAKGDTTAWDGRMSREVGDWFGAGRQEALAFGAEVRHEKYTQVATPYAASVVSSTGFDPGTDNRGARSVWAVYGELNMPIAKNFELTASVRHDHYPDFGSTTNPKLSFKFTPLSFLAVRGSASTGFRAPSLFELYSAQVFTNTANPWNDPVRCPNGKPIAGVSAADNCQVQFMALTGGNPKLQPEKSNNATLGFVFQPIPDFDATVDFWRIRLKNSIGALSDQTVFGDPVTYGSHFVRAADGSLASDGSLCNTASNPGPTCGYVVLLNDNLGGTTTAGVDVSANYRLTTSFGKWAFRVQETYVSLYRYQNEKGGAWVQNVGTYEGNGPVFRNQLVLSSNWQMGPWSAGLVGHYKSGYLDEDVGQAVRAHVGGYTTWDLNGSWAPMKALSLTLGVRNIGDKKPPHTEQGATFQVGYDPRFTDPYLRTYYVRGEYRF